jgi:hypothetical protein
MDSYREQGFLCIENMMTAKEMVIPIKVLETDSLER